MLEPDTPRPESQSDPVAVGAADAVHPQIELTETLICGRGSSESEENASALPQLVNGFALVRVASLPDLEGFACFYKHQQLGTEALFLKNRDALKGVSIAFATPPSDSSGVQHITEHDRFRGSVPYPSEDPINDYERGSLCYESNAGTYDDYTAYYAASTHDQDFSQLYSMLLGSAFHALHRPPSFRQEGRRLERDSDSESGAGLRFNGVVLSEMWDYHCDPLWAHDLVIARELFPGSLYVHNSGGDPLNILSLTHEQMLEFARAHYCPANAKLVFTGDVHIESCLSELYESISVCEQGTAVPIPREVEALTEPRRVEATYPGAEDENRAQDSVVTVSWKLGSGANPVDDMKFRILEELLFDPSVGALRDSFEESGLGESLFGPNFSGHRLWGSFTIGFKGAASRDVEQIETFVLEELRALVDEGISADDISAVLSDFRLRFERRLNDPARAYDSIERVLSAWQHDADPVEFLNERGTLRAVEEELLVRPRLFEELIEERLLQNMHRVTVVLRPDRKLLEQWEREQGRILERYLEALGPEGVEAELRESERTEAQISRIDTQQARDRIRRLNVTHMKHRTSERDVEEIEGLAAVTLLPERTHNVLYLDLALDLSPLSHDLLPYAVLYGRCLFSGQVDGPCQQLSLSNSLYVEPWVGRSLQNVDVLSYLRIGGSMLKSHAPHTLSCIEEELALAPIGKREFVQRMVEQQRSALESDLRGDEADFAEAQAEGMISGLGRVQNELLYFSHLSFLRQVEREIKGGGWRSVREKLEQVREILRESGRHRANIVCDREDAQPMIDRVAEFLSQRGLSAFEQQSRFGPEGSAAVGIVVPNIVNNSGMAVPLRALHEPQRGSDSVIAWHLSNTRLWDQVRKGGGAYGACARMTVAEPILLLSSTSDPNIRRTLETFRSLPEQVLELANEEAEIRQSIIRLIGEEDALSDPGSKGDAAFSRYLRGDSVASVQRFREEILGTSTTDYEAFAESLRAGLSNAPFVVLGRRGRLEGVAEKLGLRIFVP